MVRGWAGCDGRYMTQIKHPTGTRGRRSHVWWSAKPFVALAALFVAPLAVLALTGAMPIGGVVAICGFAVAICFVQWVIGPWIVRWAVPARKVDHDGERYFTNEPIGAIVTRRCRDAGLPPVTLGIVDDGTPNAFAFGRTRRSAHVYVTRGLLERLDEDELDAVIAHELGHVRHLDMVLMSVAMVVPLTLYMLGRALIDADDDDDDGGSVLLGLAVLVLWLVSEFVVLWLSRTRELAADDWSCECTGKGDALVSALVKIGYGMTVGERRREVEVQRKEEARNERAVRCMSTFGIFDHGAAGSMVNGFVGGLDVDRAVAAVRWEAHNPWARVLEKASTHPLVGSRIASLQASGLPGRPTRFSADVARVPIPASEARNLRVNFVADAMALVLPWVALATSALLLWADQASLFAAVLLTGSGALFAAAQARRYPFPHAPVDEVTGLLERLGAGPVHGIPVEVHGRIVGRDMPGYLFGSDLVLEDRSGIVALDYRSPIPFANAIFGFRRAMTFVGQDVVVRGWYRRIPEPVIELRELRAADGERVRPRLWTARFVAAGAVVVAGVISLVQQLAATGGT
jgi:Zn-dependent protease with chaperone function